MLELKRKIANYLIRKAPSSFSFTTQFMFHGVPVVMHFESARFFHEVCSWTPQGWVQNFKSHLLNEVIQDGPCTIEWIDARKLVEKMSLSESLFIDDPWPEVFLDMRFGPQWEVAIQRDFVAVKKLNWTRVAALPAFGDGFYNTLRWYLPQYLVPLNKVVIHSACWVNEKKMATLFIGPSGAGKSTLSSLFSQGEIIGDDLNILDFYSTPKIETCGLGQNRKYQGKLGSSYPLQAIYTLRKSARTQVNTCNPIRASKVFLSNLPYPQWTQLSKEQSHWFFNQPLLKLQGIPFREFEFSLSTQPEIVLQESG